MADAPKAPGETGKIRTLFCFGVLPAFFELGDGVRKQVFDALVAGFSSLDSRFGVSVLGTLDDDRSMVGPSTGWPWTCYILADVPGHDTIAAVCNILRQTEVGESRLWRYIRVEARSGRKLFFGNQ
jgi:hypothetical protein